MMNSDNFDNNDLCSFAARGDQRAFSEFVNRRFSLVYSVALRALNGDHHLAKDAALQVFTDSARKARQLAKRNSIEGWLFTSARYVACKLARKRIREIRRETTAASMTDHSNDASPATRQEVQLLLDAAIESLSSSDRSAIVLRFYSQLDYAAIGGRLGVSANAARMRVERALQKLQAKLTRRGIISTRSLLARLLKALLLWKCASV